MIGTQLKLDPRSTPRFDVEVDAALPAACWLATVTDDAVRVACGPLVERTAVGVVEGCWDEPFEAFDFDRAAYLFGSGVRMRDDGVAFVAPSHTLEGLYVHETPHRLAVSNSLAFLLEREGIELPASVRLCAALATVAYGSQRYQQVLHRHAGGIVGRFYDAVLRLGHGRVEIRRRTSDRRLPTFASYRSLLESTLRNVAANGIDAGRARTYDLIATVSSGYDSAACAVVAAACGCREGVTLSRSRFGRTDSGEEIGRRLGLDVGVFQRTPTGDDRTAEFMATGYGGEDAPFAAFEARLPGRILVTGWAGLLWERTGEANTVYLKRDLSGTSLGEYRLRVGFVHVPLVTIGALSGHDVMAITRSDEMRPFTLGTSYDKPIARRLLEEAGVPRELFGQSKEAVSVLAFTDLRAWPSAARSSFEAFVARHATVGHRIRQRWWSLRSFGWRGFRKVLKKLGWWRASSRLELAVLGTEWVVFEHSAPITSELAFRWALDEIRPRYAKRGSDRSEVGPSAPGA